MKSLKIQGGIFGAIADINQWSNFSCINIDGSLNVVKYSNYMRFFANMGANCTRELPFLVTDKHYQGNAIQRNYQPFIFYSGKYSLSELNEQYFSNFKEMIKAAHRHGMGFQWSIFDRCHGLLVDSCWVLNHQSLEDAWYDWNLYAQDYVREIIDIVKQAKSELAEEGYDSFNIMFELENEPMNDGFTKSGVETYKMLKEAGFKDDQIELGVFYIGDEIKFNQYGILETTPLFNKFKKAMRNAGLYDGSQKGLQMSTVHDFANNQEKLKEILSMIKHTRRFAFSNDGEKPKRDRESWYVRTKPIFQAMKDKGKTFDWKFEALYRGDLGGHSMLGDFMFGLRGIADAYRDVWDKYPENYGRFPEVILPPEEEEELIIIIEEPEPTEPEPVKEINMFKKLWSNFKKWMDENKWVVLSYVVVFLAGGIIL